MQNRSNQILSSDEIVTFAENYFNNKKDKPLNYLEKLKIFLLSDDIIRLSENSTTLKMLCDCLCNEEVGHVDGHLLDRFLNPYDIWDDPYYRIIINFGKKFLKQNASGQQALNHSSSINLNHADPSQIIELCHYELALITYHAFACLSKKPNTPTLAESENHLISHFKDFRKVNCLAIAENILCFGIIKNDSKNAETTFINESLQYYLAALYIASHIYLAYQIKPKEILIEFNPKDNFSDIAEYIQEHRYEENHQEVWKFVIKILQDNHFLADKFHALLNKFYINPASYKGLQQRINTLPPESRFELSRSEFQSRSSIKIIASPSVSLPNRMHLYAAIEYVINSNLRMHKVQLILNDGATQLEIVSENPALIDAIALMLKSASYAQLATVPSNHAFFKRVVKAENKELEENSPNQILSCAIQ